MRVWDLKDGKELVIFTVDEKVTTCGSAPDCRTVVAGDSFGRVHLLQLVEADETKPAGGTSKNSDGSVHPMGEPGSVLVKVMVFPNKLSIEESCFPLKKK